LYPLSEVRARYLWASLSSYAGQLQRTTPTPEHSLTLDDLTGSSESYRTLTGTQEITSGEAREPQESQTNVSLLRGTGCRAKTSVYVTKENYFF